VTLSDILSPVRRIFKTRYFNRWSRKTELTDESLGKAVSEMERGLVDADLGGGVVKKRVALPGRRCRRFVMTKRLKAKSPILEAVHETASDLHRLGFIDKRKMREFDALCLEPIPEYDSKKIRAVRQRLKISQAVLAAVLNTSLSTVRQWEIGAKHPSGPSLKLLNLIDRKGLDALL